jgi:hypothetical protein
MKKWSDRSDELASLFNPAFCGTLLFHSVRNYSKEAESGMPFSLSSLVLPLVLNCKLRSVLPETIRTPFEVWCRREGQVRIGLAARVRALLPITKESIVFLGQHNLMTIKDGALSVRPRAPKGLGKFEELDEEISECFTKARVLGIMMARTGDEASVLMTLGLTV